MTNHPRYSPPPQQQPQHRPVGSDPGYPGAQRADTYSQQPYDWRYAAQPQQQFRAPYDPYRGAVQPTAVMPQPRPPQKRSRAGLLTAGALANGPGDPIDQLVNPKENRSSTKSVIVLSVGSTPKM